MKLCKNEAKPIGGITLEPMITLKLIDFTAVAGFNNEKVFYFCTQMENLDSVHFFSHAPT